MYKCVSDVCLQVCTNVSLCKSVQLCLCTSVYTCIRVQVCAIVHVYKCVQLCLCTSVYTCIHVQVCAIAYVYKCVEVSVQMYAMMGDFCRFRGTTYKSAAMVESSSPGRCEAVLQGHGTSPLKAGGGTDF